MNKRILIVFCSLFLVALAATAAFVTVSRNKSSVTNSEDEITVSEEKDELTETSAIEESETADEIISNFGEVGQTYTLHSRQYKNDEQHEENALSLGFNGDMEVTVNEINLLEYSEDDDETMSEWSSYSEEFEKPYVLEAKITLKNISAEKTTGQRYLFDTSVFRVGAYQDLIPENEQDTENYYSAFETYASYSVYFDPHADEGTSKFTLSKGETQDYTVRFLISEEFLKQKKPYLAFSGGDSCRFGIMIPDSLLK